LQYNNLKHQVNLFLIIDIAVLLSYIHAHNHKSTEDDNVSIPYH